MRSDTKLWVLVLVATSPLTLWSTAEEADARMIAHWTMDSARGAVVPDASGNAHDATFFSLGDAAPSFVAGMLGNAIQLDGAREQGLTVANSETLNIRGPFTVMAWVKPARRNATLRLHA